MSASASQYAALITSEHALRPKFVAWVQANVQPFVDLQNQLMALQWMVDIDVAVGDQLDKLGEWIGVSRYLKEPILTVTILDDTTYRILLKLFIAMNVWDGTVPGIYEVWNTVFAAQGYELFINDNQDMTMDVVLANPPSNLLVLAVLTGGYFLMRPAGVRITGYWEPSLPFPATPFFGLDAENATISGLDVGAWMVTIPA